MAKEWQSLKSHVMENIRYIFEGNEVDPCIEAITNKLLTIPKDSQVLYANVLLHELDNRLQEFNSKYERGHISHNCDGTAYVNEEDLTFYEFRLNIATFIQRLVQLFQLCNIDLGSRATDLNCNTVGEYMVGVDSFIATEKHKVQTKIKTATMAQKWTFINALLESADWNSGAWTLEARANFGAFICECSCTDLRDLILCVEAYV